MKIEELNIKGTYLIELEKFKDERGTFARQFCKQELKRYGLDFDIKQCNLSNNFKKGVLRGMHYQKEPYPEIKLVSCMRGGVYDVVVDLRKDSPTYKKWIANELDGRDNTIIYIPSGVAHGFQVLEDDSLVYYQLGEYFMPEYYDGVRYDDPSFGIDWPIKDNIIINERDKSYELL